MIPVGDAKATSFKKPNYQNSQLITSFASVGSPISPSHLILTRRKINVLGNNALKYNLRGTQVYSAAKNTTKRGFCHQRRYHFLTSKFLSFTLALVVYLVFTPRAILSAPPKISSGQDVSSFKSLNYPSSASIPFDGNNPSGGESVSLDHDTFFPNNNLHNQVVEEGRMKREVYADDDGVFDNINDEDDDTYAMDKRGLGGANRARRVSMMRLKKTPASWTYPKRMSMMRLRRNLFLPPFGDIRKTRGMGNVSMLRLRRANSIAALMRLKRMTQMRLKRMTQMRLKRMTQMRLKKSGLADLAYTDDNELPSIADEDKRDAGKTWPAFIESGQDSNY